MNLTFSRFGGTEDPHHDPESAEESFRHQNDKFESSLSHFHKELSDIQEQVRPKMHSCTI